jgi:hypothetical protein
LASWRESKSYSYTIRHIPRRSEYARSLIKIVIRPPKSDKVWQVRIYFLIQIIIIILINIIKAYIVGIIVTTIRRYNIII